MFPPCALVPFQLILFLQCFPLRKLPLPFLALKKCLYFREQDTGQGLHLMVRYSCAVVVDFSFPRQ